MRKVSNVEREISMNAKTHNMRSGQAITPFGTGAMVDFIDQTLMAAAPEHWGKGKVIHDERLEKVLGVDEFKTPLSSDEYRRGLPFVRFPEWYFCPNCRKFKPISEWESDYRRKHKPSSDGTNDMRVPQCLECRTQLVPARIVVACEDGHIHDFPWIEWVHYKRNKNVCSNPKLIIKTGSSSSGLEGIKVECTSCKTSTTMAGSFGKKVFEDLVDELIKKGTSVDEDLFRCKGTMPWKGKSEACDKYPRTLQRGASNVYFSKIESSIVIPPYSDKLTQEIEQSDSFDKLIDALNKKTKKGKRDEFFEEDLEDYIDDISQEIHKNKDIIRKIVERKLQYDKVENQNNIVTKNVYKEEEYKALVGDIPSYNFESCDFVTESMNIDDYNMLELSKVVLVKKMREVRALTGFTRINPPDQNIIGGDGERHSKSKLVSVKEEDTNWYPAMEVRGEGIFIEFNTDAILKWIEDNPLVRDRAEKLHNQYAEIANERGYSYRVITHKFILLHTIAHLLIRELSFECGYSSASLRERIYCNETEDDYNMSGIFIYTASGDSEGTLGGLVRQGRPDTLPRTIYNAVNKAKWCSSDPVCIESSAQGRDSLNISACHACTLVSETSCEEFNVFLDRAMIVGTIEHPEIGFFNLPKIVK